MEVHVIMKKGRENTNTAPSSRWWPTDVWVNIYINVTQCAVKPRANFGPPADKRSTHSPTRNSSYLPHSHGPVSIITMHQ